MGWREMPAVEEARAHDHRLDYVKRGPLVWPEHKGGPRPAAPVEVSREPISADLDPEGISGEVVTMSDGSKHHVWQEFDRGTERYEIRNLQVTEPTPEPEAATS